MLYADGIVALALLVLWIYALFDVITTRDAGIRNLPKSAWLVLVLLIGPELLCAGALLWFVAGRPTGRARSVRSMGNAAAPVVPAEYDRPGRARAVSPDDDAAFLAALQARAQEQRRLAEAERRRLEGPDPV